MEKQNIIHIEIRGVYDGVCVLYHKDKDIFEWRQIVIERTTPEQRKQYETNLRKQFK